MLVSPAATLEDKERESTVDSVSKRDGGEETGRVSLPSTKLVLLFVVWGRRDPRTRINDVTWTWGRRDPRTSADVIRWI